MLLESGQYMIITASSNYMIDITTNTTIRLPRQGAADLRRDGEPIHFLEPPEAEIGKGMELLLSVREDGVKTVRMTTPVIAIEKIA